jgi:endoglucanase
MRYTVDETLLPPDGRWHVIRIPLSGMGEHGAWINVTQQWVEPRGQFSWERVHRLEFVAEYGNIMDKIWFDSIRVIKLPTD